jgi:hypothetical protein
MLVRVDRTVELRIPDTIPVDVTEHFRERTLPPRLLLNGMPLVNYASTLQSSRTTDDTWGSFQCLLIGSVFVATRDSAARQRLALRLWKECSPWTSPRAVSLMATGIAFSDARFLLREAPIQALVRFGLWLSRRPSRLPRLFSVRRRFAEEFTFLINAPLTRHFAERA